MQPPVTRQVHYWHWLRLVLAVCLLTGALIALFVTPLGAPLRALLRDPDPERLQQWLAGTEAGWVPVLLMVLMVLHSLVPLPAELLALAAGMFLGPWWGVWTIWIGAMGGAYLAFFLARVLGRDIVDRFTDRRRLHRVQHWMKVTDVPVLLTIRLIPVISFNLINYALGLTQVGWWRFTWTTAVGILPVTVVSVAFGAYLSDLRVLLFLVLIALGVCAAGFLFLRRRAPEPLP